MKQTFSMIAIVLAIFAFGLAPAFSDAAKADKQEQIATGCNIAVEFSDPEAMAKAMANPARLMELVATMNNPQTAQALMACSADANQWGVWMANMSNPVKMMNAMTLFMNPQVYSNWMAASMNPQTYQPMFAYANPAFYTQWMTAMMNPAFYQPFASVADVNAYTKMFESFYKTPTLAKAESTK